MIPMCKKDYLRGIAQMLATLAGIALDAIFICTVGEDDSWLFFILVFSALLVYLLIETVYWILQPNVLIYQYEQGIVINRHIQIAYKSIEKVYRRNYWNKKPRGNYYRDPYVGTVYIQLKSGKIHKIRNVLYPLDVVDSLWKIKQQKKFR